MFPILLKLGPLEIHTYGALIVTGFLIGVFMLRKKAVQENLNPDHLTDMSFWSLLMGLVGGRVLFVITQWSEFAKDPIEIFKFWKGGLVYYGGLIGGVGTFVWLARRYRIFTLQAIDMAAPSLAIAHFFGRLGCFAAGCCFGHQCDPNFPLAVVFRHPETIAPIGIPLHPAQLYDAVNALILCVITYAFYPRRKFHGQVAALYFVLYAIGRSLVEGYRGDSVRGFVIDNVLSTSQFISIFVFVFGVGLWIYARKRFPLTTKEFTRPARGSAKNSKNS